MRPWMILDRVGLCKRCQHVKVVESAKQARFYLCQRSITSPDFPRYPRLPVLSCPGFEDKVAQPQEEVYRPASDLL